ncbi:TetR/AcrR family transcriptional regulator [Pseudonocardia eucalypti]|uniref:TetR/AcrR family transcriptional regulator n=1 Tax=Pseudonocardia eucalypti TaxID=648755 RepID=A0ABP9RC90_9PSEU|nr:TetR/AcrR family transcriptional repressor of nem operon [Pseudonocardia eucalypti]
MPRPSSREEVVAAAQDRFHRRGYHASGVKDITDAAGLPKGSFYNYFASKEDMAIETLRRYGQSRQLHRLGDQAVPPLQRVSEHFEFLRADVVNFGIGYGCMFGNFAIETSEHSEALRTFVREALGRWVGALAGALRDAQARGELPAGRDVDLLAAALVRAWQGALLHARVLGDPAPLDEFETGTLEPLLAKEKA